MGMVKMKNILNLYTYLSGWFYYLMQNIHQKQLGHASVTLIVILTPIQVKKNGAVR